MYLQQPCEGRDNHPSFTGKCIESPGALTPGLRLPGRTEMVPGAQDTKLPGHSPTATLPHVLGLHQWDGFETPVCPQPADMGKVNGSIQRDLLVWTLLTMCQYKGVARSTLALPSVFLSEDMSCCIGVAYSLTSQIFAHPLQAWNGPRSQGWVRVWGPAGFPWVSLLSLPTDGWSWCPILALILPALPICPRPLPLKSRMPQTCVLRGLQLLHPILWPSENSHPPHPSAHRGPVLASCSCWKLLKTREMSSLMSGGQSSY